MRAELVTDWPALFVRHGFAIVGRRDIIAATMPTWDRTRAVYEERRVEVVRRHGVDSIVNLMAPPARSVSTQSDYHLYTSGLQNVMEAARTFGQVALLIRIFPSDGLRMDEVLQSPEHAGDNSEHLRHLLAWMSAGRATEGPREMGIRP